MSKPASDPQVQPTDDSLGLSVDMLDVDKLEAIATALSTLAPGKAVFLAELAKRLDTTVREIGMLRQRAGMRI